MKKQKQLFNDMLRRYKRYLRKLDRLELTGRNEHRQGVLHRHITRLQEKLNGLMLSIKGVAALAAVSGMCMLAAPDANAQAFGAAVSPAPFGFTDVGENSKPSFVDLDGDGDMDMMAGDYDGNFSYFENTGTSVAPAFSTAVPNPFGLAYQAQYAAPSFADLDGDGDLDMITGEYYGNFYYFENTGSSIAPAFGTAAYNPFGLAYIGDYYTTPSFVDLDADGDMDIVAGETNGGFYYFENTGTSVAPAFSTASTNPFGLAGIGDDSTPSFADVDGDGDFDMMTGGFYSNFSYFENTGSNIAPDFAAVSYNPFGLTGMENKLAPAFADLDNDGYIDMISGDRYGTFSYYKNITGLTPPETFATVAANPFGLVDAVFYSNPIFEDLDSDGDLDLLSGNNYGGFFYFENTGTSIAPAFGVAASNPIGLANIGSLAAPTFADLDGDGDKDLLSGVNDGTFAYFQNTGTSIAPAFATAASNPFGLADIGDYSVPSFVDLDADGDMDIMVGDDNGDFFYFENTGTSIAPAFASAVSNPIGLANVGGNGWASPSFADVDMDGDMDLLSGNKYGEFAYFENTGTSLVAAFAAAFSPAPFGLTDIGSNSAPSFGDIDGDGDMDIMVGNSVGNFSYFENTTPNTTVPNFISAVSPAPFGLSNVGVGSNPSFADLDGDGDLDMMSGDYGGTFSYFQNTGNSIAPAFGAAVSTSPFGLTDIGSASTPYFVDFDSDGDFDILTGDSNGDFIYFENTGTALAPAFAAAVSPSPFGLTSVIAASFSTLSIGDLDADGDMDLLVGDYDGTFSYFQNTGSSIAPAFAAVASPSPFGLADTGDFSTPFLVDLNGNGLLNLMVGDRDGDFTYFQNIASPLNAFFPSSSNNPFGLANVGNYSTPTFADLDGDGDMDMIAGNDAGTFSYFENKVLITWDGSTDSDWSTASNWSGDAVPTAGDDVVIPDVANDPVITTDVAVNSIEIESTASLTITTNSLTVNGDIDLKGTATLASGASLIPLGSINPANQGSTVTVNRNTTFGIADGKYSVMGSPIAGATTSSLGSIVYKYDETIAYDPAGTAGGARFIAVTVAEFMGAGEGYFSANTGNISFVGTPYNGNKIVGLIYDEGNDGVIDAGFNLVANPYTAAISYTNLMAGNTDIDGTIYLWDDGGSDIGARSNSDYITATGMGTTGSGTGSGRAEYWDGYIRSTQGFFVKANTAGTLNFTPSMMVTGNNSDGGFFREEKPTTLRFALSSNESYNDILIGFKEDATANFDRTLDAYKAKGNKDLQLYSRMSERIMAIQALPELADEMTVDLGFDVADAGTYTFELKDADQHGFGVYLKDHQLGKLIDLYENNSYTFNSEAVQNSNRFSLIFSPNSVLAIGDETITNEMIVFSNANGLNIRMSQKLKNATVKIYNLSGTLVKEVKQIDFTGADWNTSFNQKGLFILTVQSEGQLYVKKFLK